jgi:diguanylate cyclase (GGDEF)-like protein
MLPNGSDFIVNLQAEAVFDDQLKALTIVGTAQDISERKRSEREIHRLAYYDSLTGLPNRVLFKDRVTQAIAHAHRYQYHLALLFLDLDRFKVINDTLGHNIGDLLLKHVADRLAESVRHSDSIGRSSDGGQTHELVCLGATVYGAVDQWWTQMQQSRQTHSRSAGTAIFQSAAKSLHGQCRHRHLSCRRRIRGRAAQKFGQDDASCEGTGRTTSILFERMNAAANERLRLEERSGMRRSARIRRVLPTADRSPQAGS